MMACGRQKEQGQRKPGAEDGGGAGMTFAFWMRAAESSAVDLTLSALSSLLWTAARSEWAGGGSWNRIVW